MKTRAQELGEAIAVDRANSKVSQEDVAKAVGVTQQAFSGWEAGTSVPRLQRLDKLAEFFGPNSHTAMIAEHIIPKGFGGRTTAGNTVLVSADDHNALRNETWLEKLGKREYFADTAGEHITRRPRAIKEMGSQTAESKQSGPPISTDDQDRVEQPHTPYGIKSFEERAIPSIEIRDALSRAAKGVQLARQVLDDAADQLDRAIANLPRI